jgi:hypothetical protein
MKLTTFQEFKEVPWQELKIGDKIYYEYDYHHIAHGPFVVIDPEKCIIKNINDCELCLPKIKPLRLVPEC